MSSPRRSASPSRWSAPFLAILFLLIPATTLFSASSASAQNIPIPEGAGYLNEYFRPGRATITVNVWGAASRPGIWRIEKDLDLIEFLTVVGVPGVGQQEAGTRTKTFLAVYRTQGDKRQTLYRERVEGILAEGATYPALQNNDIVAIEVESKRTFSVGLVSTIVGTLSSLSLLILNFTQ